MKLYFCSSVKAGEVSTTPDPDLDTFLAFWRFFLYRFFKFSNIFNATTKNKNNGYSKERNELNSVGQIMGNKY